jgi:osmotically-inducible protein OsmY
MADHQGKGPRGWSLRDDRVIEEVSDRLMDDRLLDARHIEVSANAGVVTLEGDVPGASDVAHAEMLVRQAPGVNQVVNRLRVEPGARAIDRPAEEAARYEGRWGRWVPPFIT